MLREINQNIRPSSPIHCRDRRGNAVAIPRRERCSARHMEPREVSAATATAKPSSEPAIARRATNATCIRPTTSILLCVAISTLDLESGVSATSLRMSDLGYSNKAQSELQLCYRRSARILPEVESTPDSLQLEQQQRAQDLPDTLLSVVERQELSERAISL